ncbi:GPP34 family phosphoprotein [Nocardioides sp. InS609-2]|uniref:GOLPH3/VPS74 family protein n=1 Tax=Nocardioides sp. InS609-2 TaxID=2760705 RepID=UPI0020C03B5B|nr:GPP34 family phosphoprotein [Nocardioides sp. InS609-2]
MSTLIAEDLLLLLLDDAKGTLTATSYPQTILGGGLLIELALTEAVEVGDKEGFWRTAKVRARLDARPADPVLVDALAVVNDKERGAQDLVNRLGKGLKETLTARLEQRGILERRDGKVLGLFPRTTWPSVDSTHEQTVRRAIEASLLLGATPDERTGALIALLHAIGQAHKVIDRQDMPAAEVKARAKKISEGAWAAKAVKDAIAASVAATTAAVTAATSATVVSS